jgi:hypothetical protein
LIFGRDSIFIDEFIDVTTGCKNVVYRLSKTELPKEQSSEKTTIETVLWCASLTSNKQLQ